MKIDPENLSPEALLRQQEDRVTKIVETQEPKENKLSSLDKLETSDDLKNIAFRNKAKALFLVSEALDDIITSEPKYLDTSVFKDLVSINDTVSKSIADDNLDDKGLQVLIQQMFNNYNGTDPAKPVTNKPIDIVDVFKGGNDGED